ncbi:PDDEXK_1 domain-containing protein/Exonuclease [Helicobacter sp. NHP19-003]|uniref:PDDEXK_1 domain-containing protein/Exonuclease n=1 Tax=Helicobacter gastrocanis TaxID=2849641 RepID=A0ABN6I361_9HELI|nr:PD-(D/E)XK nuclease family protein [Helicobacter sp. NHP19-003]BCZ17994.1 PDDEXK_1 domain-containing protein/Exonuclease [Helicobacter sp. NHP19-003]
MKQECLYVFSHQRACKAFLATQPDGFLPPTLSVKDFYAQISYVPNLIKIPQSVRQLLLAHAIEKVLHELPEKDKPLLVFEKSFLGYLEGSNFVGRFFNELAKFNLDIYQIKNRDIYGDYTHHLEVLERIYEHYTTQLQELGFYDPILRLKPVIIPEILQKFSRVEFYLGGSLSLYEQELLFAIGAFVPIFLHASVDRYNKGFLNFLNLELKEDHSYKIDLQALSRHENPILETTPKPPTKNIHIHHFNTRLEQAALALARVQEWLEAGLEPSRLAIITPDSSLTAHLHLLDTKRNLNFAHGQNVKWAYQSYFEALKNLKPSNTPPLEDLNTQCLRLMEQLSAPQALQDFHQEFYSAHSKVQEILSSYAFVDWIELYTRALKEQRVDDTMGGQVKVLDVLECRGLEFDKVVILDFTDQLVPNLADHDLFLNSKIRALLNMPTLKDKKNLQKHYYYQILQNSQEVDIAYHSANNATYSKMLLELGLEGQIVKNTLLLFPPEHKHAYTEDTCTAKVPQNFKFSATSLNHFVSCPRRFYLKYLQGLNPPANNNADMGSLLHALLKTHYAQHPTTPITAPILLDLAMATPKWQEMSALEKLGFEVAVDKMQNFFTQEGKRLAQGQVWACEREFVFSFEGFTLRGWIDRIDALNDGSYALIDYKYKSSKDLKTDTLESVDACQDFQLSLYALAAMRELGHAPLEVCFYSLKDGELKYESQEVLRAKQERLRGILNAFKQPIDFAKNPSKKNCQYCAYQDICGVEYKERREH